MKRSPWFNARTEPPVNGGLLSVYEHRCLGTGSPVTLERASAIKRWASHCDFCQWRGLLREDGMKA